jgi:hypothetical protein
MRLARFALTALLLALAASPARAQGSVFALRGLGWSGRPVSSRTAGTAGAMAMFDPAMGTNPAAITRWRSVAAWAVAAPTKRTFDGKTGTADLQTVRFPLIGFAAQVPPRTTLGFSISDYLDRTWTVTQRDSTTLGGVTEPYTDAGRSIGGVSDVQLTYGYRVHNNLQVGAAFHYYLGSTRLTSQRVFDNRQYAQVLVQSQTDFRGPGIGAGLITTRGKLELSLSGRLNGKLKSVNTTGTSETTQLPLQGNIGLRWMAVPGVFIAGTAQYEDWSRSGVVNGEKSLAVWSVAGGIEVLNTTLIKVRSPLRVGYRWRQLPFTSLGETVNESAVAGGFGMNLGGGRAVIDLSVEHGKRDTSHATESFNTLFLGLTVRP